jgi:putative MATE family efflux protein
MAKDRTYILSAMPVRQAIMKMSLPVVFGMMVQVLYNLVDTWFIGKIGDASQLAAANISSPVFIILMAVSNIVGTGAASYISRCLGEKNNKRADETLSIGILLCIVLGTIISILGLLFVKPFVIMLGASAEVFPYAASYSRIMIACSIIVMCNFAVGQLMRAEGAAMESIVGMFIGTIVNIILDPIFIFVFDMGMAGAAVATILGNTSGLIYYFVFYKKGKSLVKFSIKKIKLEKEIFEEIFKIGIPATLSQLLMSVALIICNNLASPYGTNAIAGMGISIKLIYIGTFIFMGFGAGTQPLVGYNYGAKNYNRVNSIIKTGIKITEVIGIILFMIFFFLADYMVNVFTPIDDIVYWGARVLRLQIFLFLVVGPQMIANTSIQAFGKGKATLFISVTRQGLLFIPLLFTMNNLFGFTGLLLAQPIADGFTAIIAMIILLKILKKEEANRIK